MTRPTKADIKRELDELKRDPDTIAERYAHLVGEATATARDAETELPSSPLDEFTWGGWESLIGPQDPDGEGESESR